MTISKKSLVMIIAVIVVLVSATAAFLILTVPVWMIDPIDNTADALLYDLDWISKMGDRLENSGYEARAEVNLPKRITSLKDDLSFEVVEYGYGSDEDEIRSINVSLASSDHARTVYVTYDENTFSIGGLLDDEDAVISIPRKDVRGALDASVLNPESETKFSLTEESYESLCAFLEDEDGKSEIDRQLEAVISATIERCRDIVKIEDSVRFAEGAFKLEREIKVSLEGEGLVDMIYIMCDEINKYENLREIAIESGFYDMLDPVEAVFRDMQLESVFIIRDGMIKSVDISIDTSDEFTTEILTVALETTKEWGKAGFTLTVISEAEKDENTARSEIVVTYEKRTDIKSVEVDCKITQKVESGIKDVGDTSKESQETYTFRYDKFDKTYVLDIEGEDRQPVSYRGRFDRIGIYRGLTFAIDEIYIDDVKLEGDTVLELTVKKHGDAKDMKVADGTDFLSADEEKFGEILHGVYVKNINDVMVDIFGISLFSTTSDGYMIFDTERVAEQTDIALTAYKNYISSNGYMGRLATRVAYYSEPSDIYIFMEYVSSQRLVKISYMYDPDPSYLDGYKKATIINGKLEVHD